AHSTLTPCNLGLDGLALRAESTLRTLGVMPQLFGTITVSDGISMGTEGMKYSLVSREVIADSVETVCSAQCMDGVLAVGGCDKNMPGAMIAIARMNIPAVFEAIGRILPHAAAMAGEDPEKAESAAQSAVVLVEAIGRDLRPLQSLTRQAFETAIARAAGVPLVLDDFETIRTRVPVLCD